jgi:protocatechuate 3,4-dioxygenase beta subunit
MDDEIPTMMAASKRFGFSKLFLLLATVPHLLAQTGVTLSTTPNPSRFGAPVILSATVTPSNATGRVTFYDGVTIVGSMPVTSGTASISTIALPAGSRKLRAIYSGSSANPTAASNLVTQTVVTQPASRFAAGFALATLPALSVVSADFNGDGIADLAIGESNESARVFLGNGDGTFRASFTYAGSFHVAPTTLAVGDFNGDGKIDLVVEDSGNGFLSILLGNGDGTFQTPVAPYSVPSNATGLSSVAVGDFNGDGRLDLVVASQSLILFLGNGDGTFQSMLTLSTGAPTPIFVVVGDFNGDGRADLATASSTSPTVSVMLGNGNATFQTAVNYPLPGKASWLAVGDFNRDGYMDLVTANPDTTQSVSNGFFNNVTVLLSTGADGSFRPPVNYATGLNPQSVAVGDFNGDGFADIVIGNAGSPNISVLLGRGEGSFQAPLIFPSSLRLYSLVVGDFNGDGKADLAFIAATTDAAPTFYLDIILGTNLNVIATGGTPQSAIIGNAFPTQLQATVQDGGTPVAGATVTFLVPATGASAVLSSTTAVTDASGVARVSVTANGTGGSYTVTATSFGLNATFALTNLVGPPATLTASPSTLQSTAVGTPFPKALKVTLTDSVGNPASGVTVTFTAPSSGASALLSSGTVVTNASGVASVTATANSVSGAYSVTATAAGLSANFLLANVLSVSVNLTTSANPSAFGVPVTLTATVSPSNATGRVTFFDGVAILGTKFLVSGTASISTIMLPAGNRKLTAFYSGDTSYIAATSSPITETINTTGSAGFFAQNPVSVSPAVPASVAVGDFNGDGKADIVVPGGRLGPATVTVALGNGDGTFQTPGNYVVGQGPTAVAVGDFNGDGIADLAVTNSVSNNVSILLGNGDGTFSLTVNYLAGTSPLSIAVGDFNGDGIADLVVAGTTVNILLGKGDGTFGSPINIPGVSSPFSLVVADFNGDGKADLGVWVFVGSSLQILLGNGDGTFQLLPIGFTLSNTQTSLAASITAADFNGDGKVDLSFTSAIGSFVLLGVGDGTFQTPIPQINLGTAVGDFNGDGIPDLAGAGTVLFTEQGNGDGTFQPAVTFVSANQPSGLAVADFNGDGKADIVTANAASGSVTVYLSVIAGLVVTPTGGTPQSTLAGTQFALPLEVTVVNSGSPVSGVTITFAAPPIGASAILSSTTVTTNAAGKATVTATANGTPGSYVVTANYQGLSASFLLSNTGVGSITATGGTPQTVLLGNAFPNALQVTVKDSNGNPLSGATVTFAAPQFGASATLSSATAVTNASGVASVTATANSAPGSYTVTATYQGLTATFSLTNTSSPPSKITATGGTPQAALLTTAFQSALQAQVTDTNGNPVSGATVTFTAPSSGPGATLSSTTAQTNAAGLASVTATANNIPGSYTVTASLGSLSTSFSLTNLLGGGSNLALGKLATQSSTLAGYASTGPSAAVDGITDGNFTNGSVTATNADLNAWWQVDLGTSAAISSVVIFNRTDCCGTRLSDYWVFISNTPFLPTDTPATLQNRAGTFSSHQTTAPNPSTTITTGGVQGRYVRVQLTGTNNLSLAEVQVNGTGIAPPPVNLSQGKTATQSSTLIGYAGAGASSAVDGNTDGNFFNGSVTATNADLNAWWQVDLGAPSTVNSVVIFNRTDCCGTRLSDFWVFVSNTPFLATDTPATLQNRPGTFSSHQTTPPNPSTTITVNAQGRFVRVQLTGTNNLSLAEVQVNGTAPTPTNLSQGKTATQSSTFLGYAGTGAGSAVDGNTDGNFFNGSVTATNADLNAWWQVDLGASAAVNSVVVFNRTDCCGTRLSDYWVFISDTPFLPTDTPATLQGRAGTFSSHQTTVPNPSTTITVNAQGRYVRVQLTGTNNLSLAEVQVIGIGGVSVPSNLAQGKLTSQSSTLPGYPTDGSSSAADGNTDGNFSNGSVTATNLDPNPWWQVDLGNSAAVSSVVVWNRTDCCGTRLSDYWVFISDTPFLATDTPNTLQNRPGTFSSHQTTVPNPSTIITAGAQGRYVRVQLSFANYLSLAEVQVFGQ